MNKAKQRGKRLAIDIAGVGLIIAAPLFGWIPGPGGIPLLLAGLGLLSINHQWARSIREKVAAQGNSVIKVLFPDNAAIKLLYDIFTLILVGGAVYMYMASNSIFARGAAAVVTTAAFAIFVINRQRGEQIAKVIKKSSKH